MGYKHKGNPNPTWHDISMSIGHRNYYLYINKEGRWTAMWRKDKHNFISLPTTAATFRLAFRLVQEDWRVWKRELDLAIDAEAVAAEQAKQVKLITLDQRLKALQAQKLYKREEVKVHAEFCRQDDECPVETYHQAVTMTRGMRH